MEPTVVVIAVVVVVYGGKSLTEEGQGKPKSF